MVHLQVKCSWAENDQYIRPPTRWQNTYHTGSDPAIKLFNGKP